MNIQIDRDTLLKVIQRVQGIIEKKNTMPILSNILIDASSGMVNTLATDLEIFIKGSCSASVKEEGTITINARKMMEIIKELPTGPVSISSRDGDRVSIKAGRAVFNIVGLPKDEFPSFPDIKESSFTKITPETLVEMIDKTCFAASTDETRYNINGVFLETEEDKIKMVATDGHRLAIIEKEEKEIVPLSGGIILPRKGVMELKKLLEEGDGEFSLCCTRTYLTARSSGSIIFIRLIDGEFPDYNQVLPKNNDKSVVVNRVELLSSLKRVSILSTERARVVRLVLTRGKLELSSSTPGLGEASEILDVDYAGDDLSIGFNARYIIDALGVIRTDKVRLMLKEQLDPAVLTSSNADGYMYVIMPMRI